MERWIERSAIESRAYGAPPAQPAVTHSYAPPSQRWNPRVMLSPHFRRTAAKVVFALTMICLAGYISYRAIKAYYAQSAESPAEDPDADEANSSDERSDVAPARQITQSESMQRAIRDAARARAAADEQTHLERLQSASAEDAEAAAIAQKMLETELTSYQRSALHGLEDSEDLQKS